MIKVFNIAQFIPIEGLLPDNDISLRIYSDLHEKFGVDCEFVKPVGNIPRWMSRLKTTLKIRKEIYSKSVFYDNKFGIRIHFYKGRFPLLNRVLFNTNFLLPVEYKIYNNPLRDWLKDYRPEIIHAHSIDPDGYYAFMLSKELSIPFILTVRGSVSDVYQSKRLKKVLQKASCITTPSYSLWEFLKKDYNIKLLPHGIDDTWFIDVKKEFNYGSMRLVTVSRLLEMKNIQVVLKAISLLIADGFNVTFDIIGEGDYHDHLKRLTEELKIDNVVRFHGFQSPEYIKRVYAQTEIFVMLSYPETFGLSFFEAAAQGLYIVGVKDTGAYGHFTEQEASFSEIDEHQLCETLKEIDINTFNNKTTQIRSKINNFRKSEVLQGYYEILEEHKK